MQIQYLAHLAALDLSVLSQSAREIEVGLHGSQVDVGLTYLENCTGPRARALRRALRALAPAEGRCAGANGSAAAEAAVGRLGMLSPDMQHRRIVDGAFAAAGAPDVMPVGGAEGDALTAGRRPGCQAGSGRANVSGYGS